MIYIQCCVYIFLFLIGKSNKGGKINEKNNKWKPWGCTHTHTHTGSLKENKKKNIKGITLIALVVTIVILLILAGISISALTQTGLFGKTKQAKAVSRYSDAKETINLKLMEIETNCYSNNKEYNIKEISEAMKEANNITIEKYYNDEIASIKNGVTENKINLTGIVVSVNEYNKYKFLLGKEGKIEGVTQKEVNDTIDKGEFKDVNQFEKDIFGTTIEKNDSDQRQPISLVPDMTSSTTPSGKVSASYEAGIYKAYLAFSTSSNTDGYSWSAWPNGAGSWIMYQFEKPIRLKKLKLKSHNYIFQCWKFYGIWVK